MDNLKKILTPPAIRTEVNRRPWLMVEQGIGVQLPSDYKLFIDQFGSGTIDDFIWIHSPFTSNRYISLESQLKDIGDTLAELARRGEEIPFGYFPAPGGLFAFGSTDNGDYLYWKTSGHPDDWPVVVNEARGPQWETYDMSMTEFLFQVLTRNLVCDVFPEDFPNATHSFTTEGSIVQAAKPV